MRSKLFVNQLSPEVSESDLREIFSVMGTVDSVQLPRTNGRNRGYGFVEMASEGDAECAMRLNGDLLYGRTIRVREWHPKPELEARGFRPAGASPLGASPAANSELVGLLDEIQDYLEQNSSIEARDLLRRLERWQHKQEGPDNREISGFEESSFHRLPADDHLGERDFHRDGFMSQRDDQRIRADSDSGVRDIMDSRWEEDSPAFLGAADSAESEVSDRSSRLRDFDDNPDQESTNSSHERQRDPQVESAPTNEEDWSFD